MKSCTRFSALTGLLLLSLAGLVHADRDHFQLKIPETAVARLNTAKELEKKENNPKKAIAELKALTENEPDYYRAWHNLGLAYQNQGEPREALKAFEEARKIREKENIKDYSILNSTGWTHLNLGEFDKAEALFNQVLEHESKNSPIIQRTLNNLGYLYLQKGETDRAAFYLTKSLTEYKSPGAEKLLALVEDYENRKSPEQQQATSRPANGFAFYGFKKKEGGWTDINFNNLAGSSPTAIPKKGDKLQTAAEIKIREAALPKLDGHPNWPGITGTLGEKKQITAGKVQQLTNEHGTYYWVEVKEAAGGQ